MHNPELTVGVDLGGTKILAAIVDEAGRILGQSKKKTRVERGAEAVIQRIAAAAREAMADAGAPPDQVACLGIGAPGPLDSETGVISEAPNLGWRNVALRETLEQAIGLPVYVENDVNAGAWGEYVLGAGRDAQSLVGVFVGTGIGGGLVFNDELYTGAGQMAGEIGHICLNPEGPVCGCGRRGCLEAYSSRTAITRDILAELRRGKKSAISREVDGDGQIRSGVLARAYASGDKVVGRAVDRAAHYLGVALGSVANLLNPERIVLGGGVATALGEPFMQKVAVTMRAHTFKSILATTELVQSQLGDDAGILGAAFLARRRHLRRLAAPAGR